MFRNKISKSRLALIAVLSCILCTAMILAGCDKLTGGSSKRPEGEAGIAPGQVETTEAYVDLGNITDANPYYVDFVSEDSYMLSDSNSRYYSRSELSGLNRQQLYLAECEMYARYGGTFDETDVAQFFGSKSWYVPNSPAANFNESRFTDIERVNLLLLRAMLMECDGTTGTNPYMQANSDVDGWVLNFTESSRITKYDVQNLSAEQLIIAYSEIYARKGYIFEDDDLQMYFSSKNWYVPSKLPGSFDAKAELSEIEQDNYSCLEKCHEKVKGIRFSAGSKFKKVYDSYSEYVCPTSDTQKISPWTLTNMNAEELRIARNEIYARHGYSYNDRDFVEYFGQCSWYYPTVATNKLDQIDLSDTEEYNVKIIQAFELNLELREGKGSVSTKMSYYAKHNFMTMYLPAHWRDHCICIKPTGLSGNLEFYEKYNEEEGYGWLFNMELVSTSRSVPSYYGCRVEVYGYVTTPDGSEYYVLKVTPNNDKDAFLEEIYDLMQTEIDSIFNSIEWKSGYSFRRAY